MLFSSTEDEIAAARREGMVTALSYLSRELSPKIAHAALLAMEKGIGVDLAIFSAGRWGSANVVPLKCTPDDRARQAAIARKAAEMGNLAATVRALIEEAAEALFPYRYAPDCTAARPVTAPRRQQANPVPPSQRPFLAAPHLGPERVC